MSFLNFYIIINKLYIVFIIFLFSIVSKDSILEQLIPIWESILEEGWLNVKSAQKLKTTLFTAGSDWFVNNLIKVSISINGSKMIMT